MVPVQPNYQPYLKSQTHKLLGGSAGMPWPALRKFFENEMPKYAILAHFHCKMSNFEGNVKTAIKLNYCIITLGNNTNRFKVQTQLQTYH